jgi:predicted MFS family arabinose efflux permease
MGAGAALTIPSSLSVINDVFRDRAERARAIGVWAGTIGLGIAVGPIAGGLLLARFWWGSIFLVNVPILIAAFAGALLLVPDSKNPAAGRPDPWGAVLSITGLGLLLWAIIEAPARGWASAEVAGAGLASLAVLGVFVAWEARSSHPMLNLAFFSDRRFSVAAAAESLGVFGLLGALFVQTQFLQFDLGFSPLQAGLRILPMAAVLSVSAPLSSILARTIGIKFTVAAGLAAIAGGLWQISAVSTVATTYGDVVPGLLLIGLGAGLLLPTATNSVVGSVPQGDSGIGSASNAVALQVGGALGVAVIGSVLATRYQNHISTALAGRHVPAAAAHTILGSLGGGRHRRTAGIYRPGRVHERHRGGAGRRRRGRPRRRRAGDRRAASFPSARTARDIPTRCADSSTTIPPPEPWFRTRSPRPVRDRRGSTRRLAPRHTEGSGGGGSSGIGGGCGSPNAASAADMAP